MNENFKKLVSSSEDLEDIANLLTDSTELKADIAKFAKEPHDSVFAGERNRIQMNFNKKGDTIYLLGDYKNCDDDNSSVMEILYEAIEQKMITSAHVMSGKGLFLGLIEACSVNKLGFDITGDAEISDKEFLFNDKNSAILISVNGESEGKFVDFIYNNGAELTLLGHVTRGEIRMDDISFGFIKDYIG